MLHKNSSISGFHLLGWLLAFVFCSAIWGMIAGAIAYQYNMPFDFFQLVNGSNELFHWFILGMSYGSAIAVALILLEKFGAYNPVIAFVILMSGIILFTDMLFGRSSLAHSYHQIWLLVVPVVIIRDVVTYVYLRDLYDDSDEIHEIDINCKTIEEHDLTSTPAADIEEFNGIDEIAREMSAEAAEYGKSRAQFLRA